MPGTVARSSSSATRMSLSRSISALIAATSGYSPTAALALSRTMRRSARCSEVPSTSSATRSVAAAATALANCEVIRRIRDGMSDGGCHSEWRAGAPLADYTAHVVKRKRQRERDETVARGAAEERTESLIDQLRARELARRSPTEAAPSPDAAAPVESPAPAAEPEPLPDEEPDTPSA